MFLKLCRFYHEYGCVDDKMISTFESVFGKENISTNSVVLSHHSRDEGHHKPVNPQMVLFAKSVEMVSKAMKMCNDNRLPVTPFGTATGLEGGCIPILGGLSIDLTHMDAIKSINSEDFDASVEPGCTRLTLNHNLKPYALYFPVDPGANASLGGMTATSASGTNAVKYGTMRENVINLQVVLPDGTVIHTAGEGRRTRKSAAGYNLTNLFVGSEGTLGIITQITLKVYGIPEAMAAATCQFATTKEAIDATIQVMQSGIPVARIEFLDSVAMGQCIRYSKLTNLQEKPTLFIEFHGSQNYVAEQAQVAGDILTSNGGEGFNWATLQEDRNRLWTARHNALYAAVNSSPGKKSYTTDVAVPISKLSRVITETQEDVKNSQFVGSIVGHVGDGNFHVLILVDAENEDEIKECNKLAEKIALRALEVGGTCTGEHGVGIGKRKLLRNEFDEGTLNTMRSVKRAFDKNNILNPGKILF